jgi:hypothetical protein
VALTRVARTQRALLEHTFFDLDGETPLDATGTVTVAVVDANGTAVTSGNASAGSTPGGYTFTLPAQSALCGLTVSWTATLAGTTVVEADPVEVVGGYFYSLAEGRGADESLASTTKYPTVTMRGARTQVEVECEEICDRAFVPRYRRLVLDGNGSDELILADSSIRTIRAVRVRPRAGEPFVDLDADQLAALVVTDDRVLRREDGAAWTQGRGNVVVEYEHGWDAPPEDLVLAAKVRLRDMLTVQRSNVPDRAKSYTTNNGTTYRVTLPEAYRTGIPFVDGIYSRYSLRVDTGGNGQGSGGGGGKPAPASRQLHFDPQYHSLFHGGRR